MKSSSSKVAAYRCSVSGCSPSSPSSAVMSRSLPAMARSGGGACYADLWRGLPPKFEKECSDTPRTPRGNIAVNVSNLPRGSGTFAT